MEYVQIKEFIFEGANYELISLKEIREIAEIFKQFDIPIK
jgi:hypothetical protein